MLIDNKKINVYLPVVLGLVFSIAFYQYTSNLYEEASAILGFHEIFLWIFTFAIAVLTILALGIPTSTEEVKLFASPFALVIAFYSGYNIFVLFNNELGNLLQLSLSTYYLYLMFVIGLFLLVFLAFVKMRNSKSSKKRSKSKKRKK